MDKNGMRLEEPNIVPGVQEHFSVGLAQPLNTWRDPQDISLNRVEVIDVR